MTRDTYLDRGRNYVRVSHQKAAAVCKKFGVRLPRVGWLVEIDETRNTWIANRGGHYFIEGDIRDYESLRAHRVRTSSIL